MLKTQEDQKNLNYLGVKNAIEIWYPNKEQLIRESLEQGYAIKNPSGSISVNTGKFTGRSPKDKFIVKDEKTKDTIWWSDVNHPFDGDHFLALEKKMLTFLGGKKIYIRDAFAGADPEFQISLRVITQTPWANLFAYNLFLRPSEAELTNFNPEWTILCLPDFLADPKIDHTRAENFTILDFTRKKILIGGSAYTGEIKKSIFTVLNYILPQEKKVLSMHCSANQDAKGETAIFFGLSGTGKTTLSSDLTRFLIGDDEHGWSDKGIFNFEGGCYAKTINLSEEKEPQIYHAIRYGALLENIGNFYPDGSPDYTSQKITENTRASYPIDHIENAIIPSLGSHPKHIFFLSCDAFGILPPISKLTIPQAMYYFLSGYTAKVAGTEAGINEPVATFSACFGRVFLPLHPSKYAHLLGEKLAKHPTEIWLINTGWSGGAYGVGERLSLPYTRALVHGALHGKLEEVEWEELPVFGLKMPKTCPEVPASILDPRKTWKDQALYLAKMQNLAQLFLTNFEQYRQESSEEICQAGPKLLK